MSQNAVNSIRSRLTSLDCHNIDEAVIDEITTIAIDEYAEPMEGGQPVLPARSMLDEMIQLLSLLKSKPPAHEAKSIIDKLGKLLDRLNS